MKVLFHYCSKICFLGCCLIAALSILISSSAHAVPGWTNRSDDQTLVYVPKRLSKGDTFKVTVFPSEAVASSSVGRWFQKRVPVLQKSLGKPLQSWSFEKGSVGPTTSNQFYAANGEQLLALYFAYPVADGRMLITRVVSSRRASVVKQYSPDLHAIVKEAKQAFAQNTPSSTPSTASAESSRSVAGLKVHPKFKAIWTVSTWSYSPSSGLWGANETIIAAFSDGSMSRNVSFMYHKDIAGLKQSHPRLWGSWRQQGGKVYIKWHGDDDYRKTEFSVKTTPGKSKQSLNGCYSLSTFYNDDFIGGSMGFAGIKTWCFDRKGQFYQRTTATSSAPGVVTRHRDEGPAGTYRINGYGITLAYHNGKQVRTGFAFLNDDAITINGSRFKRN